MNFRFLAATTALALAFTAPAQAQRNFDDVEFETIELAEGIAVLISGAGGNIGVSYGEDGTILIDDQFAPLTGKIEAAVAALGASPVDFLINTHWHGDHTGGNENFGKKAARIFAHHNVRVRMATPQQRGERTIGPSPKEALPVVTYDQGVTMHLNGSEVRVMFLGGGHTDGDSIVYWPDANIVHMGDLYFEIPGYPFIDLNSGGDVTNMLNSLDAVIRMIDDETQVIPGHGPMSNKSRLVAFRTMIGQAVELVQAEVDAGKSKEETVAAKPLDGFNRGDGFISEDRFVETLYDNLTS